MPVDARLDSPDLHPVDRDLETRAMVTMPGHWTLILTVCWKFELLGSQEMTEEVEVMLLALTQEGPRGASFPMIMVQAASLEVRLLIVTDLTLIRWG